MVGDYHLVAAVLADICRLEDGEYHDWIAELARQSGHAEIAAMGIDEEVLVGVEIARRTLPRFWSFRPDPGSEAVDAFAQVWSGKSLFLNPPFILAQTIVRRLLESDRPRRALVVLPDHVGQGWHTRLTSAARRSIRLSPRRFLHNPPHTQRWMLRAWLVICVN